MRERAETPCQKLPEFLRALLPVAALCALVGLFLPRPADAQTEELTRPTPAPGPPVIEAAGDGAALPPAPEGATALERMAGARISSSADVGEVLLARALGGSSSGQGPGPDLSSLRGFLPDGLYRDVLELRDRVVRVRSQVFGRRGIVSFGEAEDDGDLGRLRLNLQYSPDPGIRFTLVTR